MENERLNMVYDNRTLHFADSFKYEWGLANLLLP